MTTSLKTITSALEALRPGQEKLARNRFAKAVADGEISIGQYIRGSKQLKDAPADALSNPQMRSAQRADRLNEMAYSKGTKQRPQTADEAMRRQQEASERIGRPQRKQEFQSRFHESPYSGPRPASKGPIEPGPRHLPMPVAPEPQNMPAFDRIRSFLSQPFHGGLTRGHAAAGAGAAGAGLGAGYMIGDDDSKQLAQYR